jgi:hypothetical protein
MYKHSDEYGIISIQKQLHVLFICIYICLYGCLCCVCVCVCVFMRVDMVGYLRP